jgi:PAP2 superfamily
MKALISIVLAAAACTSSAWANSTPTESATLMWNRVAGEALERANPTQHQVIRLFTYVSLAQYAALSATGTTSGDVASASMRVIAGLLPSQAAFVEERHRQWVSASTERGRVVAERLLVEAERDGFSRAWNGTLPQGDHVWRSLAKTPVAPAYPELGAMRTFLIASGSAFRSAAPPALDSARFRNDLAEVKRFTDSPMPETTRIAKFYGMTTGTLAGGFWNEQTTELLRKNATSEIESARVLATMNAAMMDALIACHDTKYTYWLPRPSQVDPAIKPLIGVPNHPAYPSNHSCLSTAAALVLAHFIPQDRGRLEAIAEEAGLSRIYAGVHYRFDVIAGEEIGRKVAGMAVTRYADMLARWTRTMVAGG